MRNVPNAALAGCVILVACAGLPTGCAQETELSIDRNRVTVMARFAFNLSADLRNINTPTPSPLKYDDGLVLPDISGSAGGTTWYWGYQSASQINESVPGGGLDLHYTAGSPGDGTTARLDPDLAAGFDLGYGRELGRIRLGRERSLAWGLQAGFGSLDVNLESNTKTAGFVQRVTDEYGLGGVLPPVAGYTNTFAGPGPLISTNYTSTTANLPATSSQNTQLDSLVLGFKLGPFVEVPLYKRLSLQAGGGLAAMYVQADLRWTENLTLGGSGLYTAPRTGDYQHEEWVLGYYANAGLVFALNPNLSLFGGVQYQALPDVKIAGGGKEATLHLSQTIEALVGIRASF